MHTKDARAIGETEQRIYALPAWRETPFFTDRERAALAFTETVTMLADTHVPDEAYAAVAAEYSEQEVAALISLIVMINAWNAVGVATRAWEPGSVPALACPSPDQAPEENRVPALPWKEFQPVDPGRKYAAMASRLPLLAHRSVARIPARRHADPRPAGACARPDRLRARRPAGPQDVLDDLGLDGRAEPVHVRGRRPAPRRSPRGCSRRWGRAASSSSRSRAVICRWTGTRCGGGWRRPGKDEKRAFISNGPLVPADRRRAASAG